MAFERVEFICDGCGERSHAEIRFDYETIKEIKREWILYRDLEYSSQMGTCGKCKHRSPIWPRISENLRWEKRGGKAK